MKIKQLQFKKVLGEDKSGFWYEALTPFGKKYLIDENAIWLWASVDDEEVLKKVIVNLHDDRVLGEAKEFCQNHFEQLVNKCLGGK
jgi:hypothetical protein